MDIRNISGLNPTTSVRQSTEASDEAVHGPVARPASQTAPGSLDRLDLSQAAPSLDAPQQREVQFARKALLGIPPLSQERVNDILSRVQDGFYSKPEVLGKMADRIADQFTGAPLFDGGPDVQRDVGG